MPETQDKPVEKVKDAAEQAAKVETAPPAKREYRAILFQVALFAAIGAFAVLTFMAKTTPFFPLDVQITRALQSLDSPLFLGLMNAISWPGFAPQSLVIPFVVALVIYIFGLHWEALTALGAAALPAAANLLVKDFIRRPRPAVSLVHVFRVLDSYSFPSAHVMFYVGFFGFLWFLALTLLKHSFVRTLVLVTLGSLILLVGMSRIYLGQHWASDVLAAYLLGGLTLVAIISFYRWGKQRFFLDQPVAPHDSA